MGPAGKDRETRDGPGDLAKKIGAMPDAPGVYIFRDASGAEIYVGKAKSLRRRARQYLDPGRRPDPKTAALLAAAADVEYIECRSEVEAFLLENRLIKDLQPRFNVRLKSSATYPWVEVTWDEPFPRVLVTRDRSREGSRFYGPFVSASGLRAALRMAQRIFGFRTCSLDLREEDPRAQRRRPCLEYHVGRCPAPCAGLIKSGDYREGVRRLIMFLAGGHGDMREELEKAMKAAAAELRFEEAARMRDAIRALDSIRRRGKTSGPIEPDALRLDPAEGLKKLGRLFGLPGPPRIVEGIDIAHLHGGEAVGSLVQFIDGLPSKEGYRRYRIKTAPGADDFAAIREVVSRRYSRLLREGKPLPDIVLIDGGAGQLSAAREAMEAVGIGAGGTAGAAAARDAPGPAAGPGGAGPDSTGPRPGKSGGGARAEGAGSGKTAPDPGTGGRAGNRAVTLASLSKKEETIHTPDRPEGIRLSRSDAGLRLLQHIRDEAHRFAGHYHHILRRKRVMGEEE
ncbi:MAG: GIY-YIG nuclease family protein [Planctomycetota bacterium]|nr:GIY-YIG nuclease family protein [Planctomycetota bacterium]